MATRKKTASKSANTKARKAIKVTAKVKQPEAKVVTRNENQSVKVNAPSLKGLFTEQSTNAKVFRAVMWVLVMFFSLMSVDYIAQYLDNDYFVAVVNNNRISQNDFEKRLEQVAGEQVAETLIQEELIYQEAKKKDLKVTEADIDQEIKNTVDRIGGQDKFDEALKANGYTEESYRSVVKLNLLAAQLVVEEPKEADLEKFFTENKENYFQTQEKYEDDKAFVEDTYRNKMLEDNFGTWYQEVRADAVIQNNITSKPDYGFFKRTRTIFDKIYSSVSGK